MHKWLIGVGVLLALWLSAPSVGAADGGDAGGPGLDAGAPAATAVELTVTPDRPRYGERVQVRARVTSVDDRVPTGTVRFMAKAPSGNTEALAALDAAGYASWTFAPPTTAIREISASYAGDATHTASSWSVPIYVDKVQSAIALASSANPARVGSLRVTATVTGVPSPPRAPSGKVHFFDRGKEVAVMALDANGRAVFDATKYLVGQYEFSARYDGDDNLFESATKDTLLQTVDYYPTTVKAEVTPSTIVFGQPVTITVTVTGPDGESPTKPYFVTIGGYNNEWDQMVWMDKPGKITYTPKDSDQPLGGTHTVNVQFYTEGKYASASATTTLVVTKAPTTTTLTGTGASLTARIASDTKGSVSGTVELFEGSVRVGRGHLGLYDHEVTLSIDGLRTGIHDVVAVYGGNRDFASSRSKPLTIQYTEPPPPPKPDAGTGWPSYDAGSYPPPPPPKLPTYPSYDAGPLPDYEDYDYEYDEYKSPSCAASSQPVSQGAALLGAFGMALVFLRRRGGRRRPQ